MDYLLKAVNLLALVGIIIYATRKSRKAFIENRHHGLKTNLQEAEEMLAQSREQYQDIQQKLSNFDREILDLSSHAQSELKAQKERIKTESEMLSQKIIQDAKMIAEMMSKDMMVQARKELALKILEKVERDVTQRLNESSHRKMRADFTTQLERVK